MKRIRIVIHHCCLGELEPGDLYTHDLKMSEDKENLGGYMVLLRHNEPIEDRDLMHPMLKLEVVDE